jgi:phosphatidate cytidylyltransferase
VFLFYVVAAVSLLVLGGVVLAMLKLVMGKPVGHACAAYRGWLLIVPLLLLIFFLGREAAIVFVTFVAIFGFREFARASELCRDSIITWTVYSAIGAVGIVCLMTDPVDGQPGWYGLFMALPVFVIALILVIPVVRNRSHGQLELLALATVGFVYFGWMLGHLALLANSTYAYSYLGYLVAAVAVNDIAAYICGTLLGRHLLRSNISPKKTWEGAAGALGVSLVLPWTLQFTFPHFEARDLIVLGLIVSIGGQLGDLIVSVIKRDLRIKDMGAMIPGHGGVLDRMDSMTYVAPLFFYYVRYRHVLGTA